MVVNGFRTADTDLGDVQNIIKRASEKVKQISRHEYALLLADKAAFLFDCIALKMCERPTDHRIIDDAVSQLNEEITLAGRLGTNCKLNFSVFVRAAEYDGHVYLWVNCGNDKFLKAFKGEEEYSLTALESKDPENKKTKTWLAIFEQAKKIEPMGTNLTYIPEFNEDDMKDLKFAGIKERAEKMARHNLLNRYLNLLSGGRQIPPIYMMEYVDRAMEMLLSEDGKVELTAKVTQLEQILPDLNENKELVIGGYNETDISCDDDPTQSADSTPKEEDDVSGSET